MSVLEATEQEFSAHPWIIGGAVAALVILLMVTHKSSTTSTPAASFSYNIGPSDAQVQAGTSLAIAQGADQTALAIANTQATTAAGQQSSTAGIMGNYFNYLTAAGQQQVALGTTQSNNALALGLTQSNNALSLGTTQSNNSLAATANTNATNLTTAENATATQQAIAANNNATALSINSTNQGYAYQTAVGVAQANAQNQAASFQQQLTSLKSTLANVFPWAGTNGNLFTG
jgi:hypothetical protein